MRKHFIVGTAGHVDHGKSTLIKALTGTETDRLPEEKARGLSIDLGFAALALPGDIVLGIVDVPGHERFLKNMLAGVGGYDLGLLVVDAQEGVMPQTREHVEILNLLQIQRGVVAVTKRDLVDDEFLELVEEDLREFLRGTFLAQSPVVAVSAKSGRGLEQLKQCLQEQLARAPVRDRQQPFRLPVDRSFLKTGFGTVVTGSMWSGTLNKGDRVEILPLGQETRVRGLQSHGESADSVVAGQRVAVNLAGLEPGSVGRGQILAYPGLLQATQRIDVRIEVLARVPRPLKHRARIRFYAATSEVLGQVILLEGAQLEPGQAALAQLILDEPAVVMHKDRFVLRDFTASYTVGGGEVLNAQAERHKRGDEKTLDELRQREVGGEDDTVLAGLKASGGWKSLSGLATQLQLPQAQVEATLKRLEGEQLVANLSQGKTWALASAIADIEERLSGILAGLHANAPWRLGWKKEELLKLLSWEIPKLGEQTLLWLLQAGRLQERRRFIALPGHRSQLNFSQRQALDKLLGELRKAAFAPPTWEELPGLLQMDAGHWKILGSYLLDDGQAQRVAPGIVFLQETLEAGQTILRGLGPFTPAQARDALGTSRKFLIPLLEYYDQTGFTQRSGEVRLIKASSELSTD